MHGKLFTRDFLDEGIAATAAWRALTPERASRFEAHLQATFAAFPVAGTPNEATTEQDLIVPILAALGWEHVLPQQTASGRGRLDVPDFLLFRDEAAKRAAQAERRDADRFRYGLALVESKRWGRPLDRGDADDPWETGTPSTQMLRYLSRAEAASDGAIRWGILTNGRHWRLYWQGARSRSEEFLEVDLAALAATPGIQLDLATAEVERREHLIRVFLLLFGRDAFLPDPTDLEGRTFHQVALAESRLWEERVSGDLGAVVFEKVFPSLLAAFVNHDAERPVAPTAAYLDEIRRAALTFLYRILFVLYAEDRNLLPAEDPAYDDYSLRSIRRDIAARQDAGDALSARAARYHNHLADLFIAIGAGDRAIGLPPYNGGLFAAEEHPVLDRVRVSDAELAPMLDALSRHEEAGKRRWINYRDLSVQQLGSIYERLLEFEPVLTDQRGIELRPMIYARKGSGSYYTHDDLVRLILQETLAPRVEEITSAFAEAVTRLGRDRRPVHRRLEELATLDPASHLLDLRVCDPAMGSGHFLVSLVDLLADLVLEQMAAAEAEVIWARADHPYRSPLVGRIDAIRGQILAAAEESGWRVDPAQLDDRHLVRRIVLKRVVYGVDKNPMAVELAKVSLWLHTFTAGAPLSFLDHHLRCGDSLYGEWLDETLEAFDQIGALFVSNARTQVALAARTMAQIAETADSDIAEVHRSQELFEMAEETLAPLHRLLDLWHALRWLEPEGGKGRAVTNRAGLGPLLRGVFGDLLAVLAVGRVEPIGPASAREAEAVNDLLTQVRGLAERERFLHWELAFPSVWGKLERSGRNGGFDAVVGNPPWDRMKLQEVEWFAAREPAIARSPRAADRKKKIAALEKADNPLWRDYLDARTAAETAARVARESGQYPELARGDLNLYSLFVERGQSLIHSRGVVGLVVPSGIASDKSASEFFRGVATGGRLRALYDFENKKVFFPDVHASFKFSVFVVGGAERRFPQVRCAFFLHNVAELADPERCFPLGPDDFLAVNPNTGTAPVFRTRRDAEITTAIYQRLPVLVDRRETEERAVWPVRYLRMFDLTTDSGLFKTAAELEADGLYPVEGKLWKEGPNLYVPLYEGKMVQMYDHRAASVEIHPENVHRPAQPVPATLDQHGDPRWLPDPQHWVPDSRVPRPGALRWTIAFKDVTAPTNQRTMIAAALPLHGLGNSIPALLPIEGDQETLAHYRSDAPLLLANLNCFAFDFVARQKVQGQHLNLYIVEQIPVIPADRFTERLGGHHLAEFIRGEVLHLSYTAVDLEPMARDLGYSGDPFPWDEEDRRHRMARLDALFFHLYGLDRSDAEYILNQFPIIRADDEKAFGRFLTRDLVLAYMNAVASGDLQTRVRSDR